MLVHDRPLVHWDDGFGCRWEVAQGTVRPDGGVVAAPVFDEYLGFVQRVEDLALEQFIPEACTVTPICLTASAIGLLCPCSTSICRSFDTISSGLSHFPTIPSSS